MEYDELPDLKMTALAILYQTKWKSRKANKPADFLVKEALAGFASTLEDDDIGYLYDPISPRHLCVDPGELCGKIANSNLPYSFEFHEGVKHFVEILNAVDEDDFNRVGVIVTDCFDYCNPTLVREQLLKLDKGVKVLVFSIGVSSLLLHVCLELQLECVVIKDAADLSVSLKSVSESLTIIR